MDRSGHRWDLKLNTFFARGLQIPLLKADGITVTAAARQGDEQEGKREGAISFRAGLKKTLPTCVL